ncbi:hemogen isoform X5 [Pyxicephalus adspersus]|uniref:hemogen isoform X5 n=1 Tax=Pyxicephalus adspersus TaxID=30357 RepID=UPI003B59CF4C
MEEKKEAPVISPRRLRDRELLKRKKEEAREKDTYQWVFGDQYQSRSKRPRQTRGTGNRRRKQVKEPELQLEQQLEPQPEPESKHESDQTSEPATEIQHAPETESKPMQKEEVAEVEPDTFINPPEVLNFPVQDTCTPEQEEHQYYTPLL